MRCQTGAGFDLRPSLSVPPYSFPARYNLVILRIMKTAISLSDDTFQRVDHAAKRLGVSRSEFFAQAAERWLDALDDDGTTEAIDRAIAELTVDHAFTDAAAAALAVADQT
jgi:metal-responsive CopG/Arc/MetJ family transcriptional regulator